MKIGKSKEGWLGVVLTTALCLGFLYWWFRPEPRPWELENAGQLIGRAMNEPRPQSPAERLVLDFDLMEVAVCQSRSGMLDEAKTTLGHISDPVVKTRAVIQTAFVYLDGTNRDLGEALPLSDLVNDAGQRAVVRAAVVGRLAELGFADAALAEAKTPQQQAVLARQLALTDARDKARELLAVAETAPAPAVPAEAAALKVELAWTRVNLSSKDGPQQAIPAILALPAEEQPRLWFDLCTYAQNREDRAETVPAVLRSIPDPALRRRLEVNVALVAPGPIQISLRPVADLLAEFAAAVQTAETPAAKAGAMIALSDAQRHASDSAVKAAADGTLKQAQDFARAITDPAERARALLESARKLCDVALLPEAAGCLNEAVQAIAKVTSPADRIPLLVAAANESFMQAAVPLSVQLTDEAAALLGGSTGPVPYASAVETLMVSLVRSGQWPRALALLDRLPEGDARTRALDAAASAAALDSASMNPSDPPPRGEPVDGIRMESSGNQARAAGLVEAQPPGYARARAWLAMAKGLIAPPVSMTGYILSGDEGGGEGGEGDAGGSGLDLPGEETPEEGEKTETEQ